MPEIKAIILLKRIWKKLQNLFKKNQRVRIGQNSAGEHGTQAQRINIKVRRIGQEGKKGVARGKGPRK